MSNSPRRKAIKRAQRRRKYARRFWQRMASALAKFGPPIAASITDDERESLAAALRTWSDWKVPHFDAPAGAA